MDREIIEQRIKQVLVARPSLVQAIAIEPSVLSLLVGAATHQRCEDRWQEYEALKCMGAGLVGLMARDKTLQSTVMYENFTSAIDALLPEPLYDESA